MFVWRGVTHIFYQHANSEEEHLPYGSACWSHIASADLVTWRNFGCTVAPPPPHTHGRGPSD